jgi:Arm DNA-binding domain
MAGRLKPLDVERETKPGKYADGDGLYLIVNGPTSKNWSYRYWKDRRERWHGLGSFKDVSLKEAHHQGTVYLGVAVAQIVEGDRKSVT